MLITLLVVAAVLAVAGLCGRLAARLGQPPVISELVAGIALGPSILGAVLLRRHAGGVLRIAGACLPRDADAVAGLCTP